MKKYAIVCAALMLSACSPKGTIILSDYKEWDKLAEPVKRLNDEDRQHFTAYMARMTIGSAFTGGKVSVPVGETIGKAIEDQKKFEADVKKQEAEADMLKARATAERAAAEAALSKAALVTLVSKTYVPKNIYQERLSDRVAFVFAVQTVRRRTFRASKAHWKWTTSLGHASSRLAFRSMKMSQQGKAARSAVTAWT